MLRTNYKQNFFFSAFENILPFLSEPGDLLNLLFNLYYFKFQMCSTYQHFLSIYLSRNTLCFVSLFSEQYTWSEF